MNAHRRGVLKKMSTHVGPNMTPMVDVVMCILIFFMLGTTLATPEMFLKSNTAAIDKAGLGAEQGTQKLPAVRLYIRLSRAAKAAAGAGAGGAGVGVTVVQVFDEGAMPMNGVGEADQSANKAIFDKLASKRKSISDEMQVLIVPTKDVPWQDVITVYKECVKLQFKQVAFYPVK